MRILFLDDAPWRHDLVRARMESPDCKIAGIEVVHAWTVDEAVDALQHKGPFDQVYLDHDLNDFSPVTGKESRCAGMYGSYEMTGRDVSRWMARNLRALSPKPRVTIHSWNNSAAPMMVEDLREAGFEALWELFNGGVDPRDDEERHDG